MVKWKEAFERAREEMLDTIAWIWWVSRHRELWQILKKYADCEDVGGGW